MKLTPERLFGRKPLPGAALPTQLKVTADGRYGSCLLAAEDDRERLELWLIDLATAKARRLPCRLADAPENVEETPQERAERERRRQFAHGITAYDWHPTKHQILFPAHGGAWLLEVAEADATAGGAREITPAGTRQSGIRFSSQGNFVSYVRDGDLYCLDIADASNGDGKGKDKERRLTHDGGGTVQNGLAEFIAQEEMHRFDGHWWSPDERFIAFTRVDEAPIPQTQRHEVNADGIQVIAQRYPFAGGPNAEVRLGLLELASGEVAWLDWQLAADDYLARAQFAPDGALYVQAQSRHQQRLMLRRFQDGKWRDVLEETSATWINLHDNLVFLDGEQFLWTSERSGLAQLYRCGPSGEERLLDTGGLRVGRVLAADGTRAWVTALDDHSTTQRLYGVPVSANAAGLGCDEPLSDGRAAGALCCDGAKHRKSSIGLVLLGDRLLPTRPATLWVLDFEQRELTRVAWTSRQSNVLDVGGTCSLVAVEGPSGEHLNGRLTRPSPCLPNQRYPVVVHVYGGPGMQRVRREFPPPMLQLFAQAGFGVFELDNRGSSNRHKAFEDAIHRRLGRVEVEDQLAGVEFLRGLEWVDADRIGIFGHSYGGYMVLMCLAQSHAFRAGVAVAPVADWTLYDTHYTERYLGTPEDNPEGYKASSPLPQIPGIDAPLLLMHGMADDNVLFTHSLKLIQALQDAGKPFELMTYPGAKHALQQQNVAIHRYHCMLDFFRRTLQANRPAH